MKNFHAFYSVLICLFFFACSDENNYDPIVKKIPTLETITFSEGFTTTRTYSYDNLNRFSEIVYGTTHEYSKHTFQYENNELIKMTRRDNDLPNNENIMDFTKENDKIIIKNSSNVDGKKDIIFLNKNGFPIKYVTSNYYDLYSYDSKDRLHQEKRYEQNYLVWTITYDYDNKPGILSQVNMPKWYFVVFSNQRNYINNALRIDNICPVCMVIPFDCSYTYDNDGFPTLYTNKYNNGSSTTIQYKNISE